MNEQQLTALVERVGDSLEPDVARLVAGGAARGRVRRRRRTAGTAFAGVAVVGAVATVGLLLPPAAVDAGPDVADPGPPGRVVAVAPMDMDDALAGLLPGAEVGVRDDAAYQYQLQHGTVRWQGATVTLTIDSRNVGIASTAQERCETAYGPTCEQAPGGAWVFEGDRSLIDPVRSDDVETAYLPEGYVIEATADEGKVDREVLLDLVLDERWLR